MLDYYYGIAQCKKLFVVSCHRDDHSPNLQFYGDESLEEDLSGLYAQIDEHIAHLEDEKPEPPAAAWQSSMPTGEDMTPSATSADSSTIFDDVDD